MKSDANKGITLIEYNYLGLEEKVHFGANKRIENLYDAERLRLSQKLINGSTEIITDYMGGLIYVDEVLQSILHNEGRIKVESGNLNTPKYQFFITDHLGSTRVIIERINETTALVQETHYGAWGEKLEGTFSDNIYGLTKERLPAFRKPYTDVWIAKGALNYGKNSCIRQ